jgi:hypothetical protein
MFKFSCKSDHNITFDNYDIEQYKPQNECQNPKVSVIVPVYNAKGYIPRCLHYLIMQTLEELEIIVVNDGSTDSSMDTVKKLAEIDRRIKIINQENKLQGAARNNGLTYVRSEYVGFCDADDFVDFAYFEKLYNTAKKYDADIALAEYVRVSLCKFKPRLNIATETVNETINEKINICKQNKNECPTNKIYRTEYLRKNHILFPEGMYCEDKLFSIKAVYYANKIATTPGVRYYYWENPNSTVNAHKTDKHVKDRIKAKQDVLAFAKEMKIPVRNWYFKAEKKRFSIFGIPLIIIKESFKSRRIYLFGVLPVFEIFI